MNQAVQPMDLRKNSFTLIRYLVAFEVLIGHCITHFHLDTTSVLYSVFKYTFGMFPGVPVFFGLSGFFIWMSLDHNDSLKSFADKRFKRIFPELWIAVLLSALSILILYRESLDTLPFIGFLLTQSTFLQFWTPDCLRGFGCGTPNGSLWTISTFVQFYLVVFIAHRFCTRKKAFSAVSVRGIVCNVAVLILCVAFSVGYPLLKPYLPVIVYKLLGQTIFPYLGLFVVGIDVYVYRDFLLPLLTRFWYIPLALNYVVTLTGFDLDGTYIDPLRALMLLLTVFAVGFRFTKPQLKRDYSYGIYLYHMVFVNIFIQTGLVSGLPALVLVLVLSVLIAIASGEFVKWILKPRKSHRKASE